MLTVSARQIQQEQPQVQQPVAPPKTWFVRPSALIEIGLFFLIALVIDQLGAGNRFWDVNPHPFWIIVLLTSVQYGVKEGFLAAVVSSLVLLVGNIPDQPEGYTTFDQMVSIYINPILWIFTSIVLGELRQRHVRKQQRLAEELYEAQLRETLIAEKYQEIRKIKEGLEFRVAGQLRTAFSAYDAARTIETQEPDGVLDGVHKLLSTLVGPESYSVYLFKNDKLVLQTQQGWSSADQYPTEYDNSTELYNEVLVKGRVLTLVNEDDERKLAGHGVLAGSFYDLVSGRVFGMIKIESMGFSVLNFSTIESFRVLCEWVGSAYARALGYQLVRKESMKNPDSNMLSASFLRQQVAYLPELAKRAGFDASLISIRMVNAANVEPGLRRAAGKALGLVIEKHLRKIDQIFEESLNNKDSLPHSEYTVILPSTPMNNATIVVQKIQRQIQLNNDPALAGIELQFNIQSLFQQKAA